MAFKDQTVMENEFDDIKVKKVPREVFTTLADKLAYDWEKFARRLLIEDSAINKVKETFITFKEQTFQALNQWRKGNPLKRWRDIKDGLVFCERQDLVTECEQKIALRHSVFGMLPPLKTFFSRDDELQQIHKYVCEKDQSGKSIIVLTGMSGVGKTQLARKYAAVYNYFFENIVWVDAAINKTQISMINLCHVLGLAVKDSQGNAFDIEVICQKIHNYFESEKTLYIFDNVDDESIKTFEKFVSNKRNAFTLVTSQWKTWSTNVHQVQINPFSHQDAFIFMKRDLQTTDDETLKEIASVLRYHPLAINLAIFYIKNNNISLQNYLELFQSQPVETLHEGMPIEAETKSAITSINLVLYKIETSNEKSVELLNHLSYCDGQCITKQLIHDISKYLKIEQEYLIYRAVALLVSYSLVDRFEVENGSYTMHEITQLACKHYQKRKEITEICNKNMIIFLKSQIEEVKQHVDDGKDIYNHFIHMFRIYQPKMCEAFHRHSGSIHRLLSKKGFCQEAVNILDAVQSYNTNTYGAKNEITLNTKQTVARCLKDMGKYKEAIEISYEVDAMRTVVLGINHLLTLKTKDFIGLCLDGMGKHRKALEILYQVEKTKTETLGVSHPSTLNTKSDIALCLFHIENYKEALEINCQVDKLQTDIFGVNHPSTLDTKINLAACLYEMGKLNEALEISIQVNKIHADILGINHPSTLTGKNNIATILLGMEKYHEALEIYYQIEKSQTICLRANHPNLMITKINIASCLRGMGKYNEVIELLYQVEEVQTDTLGITHPSTLNTKYDIALCLYEIRKFNEALDTYSEVEQIQTQISGISHQSTLNTKTNMGMCLKEMGKYNEALEIYHQVERIQTELLGSNHPLTLNAKSNIANCLQKIGKFDEALEIYYPVEKVETERLGINHPSTLRTKNDIAVTLTKMGKYDKALEIYYQVDKIQTRILGINHPFTLDTRNNIALCLKGMGNYTEALEAYYEVDKIQTCALGIYHYSTWSTKTNIALCLYDMGEYSKALETYYQIDKIQTDVLGNNHPSTMNTRTNIASCLYAIRKHNETLEFHSHIDKTQTDVLEINQPSTLSSKSNLENSLKNTKVNQSEKLSCQLL